MADASGPAARVALPWQQAQWQRLWQQRQRDRLPHALLLAGPAGVGKRRFAEALCLSLLCQQPDAGGHACGDCRACGLLAAGSHPDSLWLLSDEVGKVIRIDQVRRAVDFVIQTSQQGGRKVVAIAPAEALNRHAANALLKTLEEPAGAAVVVLVSDAPGRLMPTLRSRCQRLDFPLPPRGASAAWLAPLVADANQASELLDEADGRPLIARALLDQDVLQRRRARAVALAEVLEGTLSPLTLAQRWKDEPLDDLLGWLLARLIAALRVAMGATAGGAATADRLTTRLARGAPVALLRAIDAIQAALNHLRSGGNPNPQLAVEALLLELCDRLSKV